MKTDGFICTSPAENWEYQNTGSAGARAQMSPTASAYVRVERCGAIAGTQVDENGAVSDGPVVQFTDPNGLLAGAAAAAGQRPWIVWAGVSPLSLTEVLIVWNAPIVLLSKAKIGGGQVTTVVGRLMVVQLSQPVAIHGGEVHDLEIAGGAVGVYSDGGPVCPALVNPPGGGGGGGQLSDLCALPEECGCGDVYPQDAPDDGQGQGGQAMPPLWSTMCNPDAQCGEVEDQRAQFIPNNGMRVPVRCCHPFVLVQAFNCGPSGECACEEAQVWQASMTLYGTTLPLDLFGLDKLVDIDPCCISDRWPNGYPAVLLGDIQCVPECKVQYSVEIVAAGGPQVIVQGYWMPLINGYAGQSVLWKPPCGKYCEDEELNCVPLIASDEVDCFVDEDIIKPIERTSPVSFFEDFILTTEEFTIYQTTTVGFKETQITGFEETAADVVTQFQTTETNIPNWELGEPVEIPKYTTEDQSVVTTVTANNRDIPNIDCDTAVEVVTNINSQVGNINGISDILYATVSAVALNESGDFEFLENQIGQHLDGWPGFWAVKGEDSEEPDLPTAVVTEVEVVDAGFDDSFIVHRDQGQIPIRLLLSPPDYGSLRKTSLNAVTEVNFLTGPITAFTEQTPQDIVTSITPQKRQIDVLNAATPVNVGTALLTDNLTIPGDAIITSINEQSTPITEVSPGTPVQALTTINFDAVSVTGVAVGGVTPVITAITTDMTDAPAPLPIFGPAVTDLSYTPVDVMVGLTDMAVPLATGLSYGPDQTALAGPSVTVITELDYATITACVGGEPVALVVATGGKEYVLPEVIVKPVTGLLNGPVNLPIAPVTLPVQEASPAFGQVVTDLTNDTIPVVASISFSEGQITDVAPEPPVVVAANLQPLGAPITGVNVGPIVQVLTEASPEWGTTPDKQLPVPTALDVTPITGVTPGDAVQVMTDVETGVGQVTGVAQDGDPVLVVTDISSSTQPGEFLNLADGLEVGDISFVTDMEQSGGTYYPSVYGFQTIAVDGKKQDLEIEWERRFAPTQSPGLRRMAQQNIVYADDVVLSPQNAVTAIQQQKAPITPAKCDGTLSVVTAIDEQKGTVKGVGQDGEPVSVREVDKLEDLTIKIIGTETQTFDIPAFDEKTYDVLVRDELGEDSFVVMDPDDFDVYQALVPDAEGDITLITSTEPGCAVTYKFLNHDGTPWEWTDASATPADCCEGQPNELGADTKPLPIELECKNFVLLSGKYVNQPKGTEERCPCYDGVAELACNQPENVQEPPPSGGPNPCSMRVRRIRRQFCVQCNPKSEERSC